MSKSDLKEQKINLDSIETATNAKEKNLSAKSNIFKSGYSSSTTTWKNVQAVLGLDDAVVDLVHIKKFNRELTDTIYYGALILTKEMLVPQFVVLKNGNQLEQRNLIYYRNAIKNKIKSIIQFR